MPVISISVIDAGERGGLHHRDHLAAIGRQCLAQRQRQDHASQQQEARTCRRRAPASMLPRGTDGKPPRMISEP